MKNAIFWIVTPCGFIRTSVSKEHSAFIIRVTRFGELTTTLGISIEFLRSVRRLLVTGNVVPTSPILSPR
jgi:hypothetical protein